MKSKSSVFSAVFLVCGIAVGIAYANFETLQSALANPAHAVGSEPAGDHVNCHTHRPVTYHCH